MKVEYCKDLHHNYMVLTEEDTIASEAYSKKMLELHTIEGLLSMEQRRLDGSVLLFYDITARQALSMITEKTLLSHEALRKLMTGILEAIEEAYECLLVEDDIILQPDFIYLDVATSRPYLCYYSGYRKDIFEQVSSLLEYLMNKVDYKDRDAVMLVYKLYAVTREDGYTFDRLLEALHTIPENFPSEKQQTGNYVKDTTDFTEKKKLEGIAGRGTIERENAVAMGANEREVDIKADIKTDRILAKEVKKKLSKSWEANIPIMVEKIEDEEEIAFYPLKTFVYTGLCVLGGILLFVLSFTTGIMYNAYGERIDYSKLFAVFLILFSVEGYLLKKIWDKNNKITKLVTRKHYVDPRKNFSVLPEEEYQSRNTVSKLFSKGIERIIDKRHLPKSLISKAKEVSDIANFNKAAVQNIASKDYTEAYNQKKTGYNRSNHYSKDNDYYSPTESDKAADYKEADYRASAYKTAINNAANSAVTGSSDEADDINPTRILNAETESGNRDEKTGVLTLKPQDEENYKPIIVKEFPFFIGKLKKNVDYCLENDVVSRYHAKITREQDRYFITDLNSMNGTFVNHEPVLTYDKKEIKPGDTITFANINYVLTE